MEKSIPTVMESQLDWLSASAHGHDRAHGLAVLCEAWGEVERQAGNQVKPWRLMGYEGNRIGRIRWGARDGESIYVQISGQLAEVYFDSVYGLADQVTRVDLATTVRFDPPDPHVAANAYLQASWYHESHPKLGVPWRVQNAEKGETTYLGSRESDYYTRIYDKEAESIQRGDRKDAKRYAGCWRYEVECKGLAASNAARLLYTSPDRPSHCQSAVYNHLRKHGVDPGFLPGTNRVLLPGFRRRSDADTRLNHLARNVRPTLDFLREAGRLADALEALGLPSNDLDK